MSVNGASALWPPALRIKGWVKSIPMRGVNPASVKSRRKRSPASNCTASITRRCQRRASGDSAQLIVMDSSLPSARVTLRVSTS
jgi:hypothetical protein